MHKWWVLAKQVTYNIICLAAIYSIYVVTVKCTCDVKYYFIDQDDIHMYIGITYLLKSLPTWEICNIVTNKFTHYWALLGCIWNQGTESAWNPQVLKIPCELLYEVICRC